jgi:hypothetical protein
MKGYEKFTPEQPWDGKELVALLSDAGSRYRLSSAGIDRPFPPEVKAPCA